MREVCVITGARSEYWILRPLLEKIRAGEKLRLYLIATGMHLLRSRGLTVRQMIEDGFTPDATVAMYEQDSTNLAAALGRAIAGIAKILARRKPAFTVVLGDRLEAFAGAAAAAALGLVLVHLHGGEVTPGAPLDESLRHAITRLAHIHCAPTRGAFERLRKMGEQEFRIHLTGSPAIDALEETEVIPWPGLCAKLGFDPDRPVLICIEHPELLKSSKAGEQFAQTLAALGSLKQQTAIIYPNNDPGSERIVREIEKLRPESWAHVFKSLPHREFVSLMAGAAALVGNSSAAFVEAPFLGLPAVNVGGRNRGRERPMTVLDCKCNRADIEEAIRKVLHSPRPGREVHSAYGDGQAAERIVEVLLTTRRSARLLAKEITVVM